MGFQVAMSCVYFNIFLNVFVDCRINCSYIYLSFVFAGKRPRDLLNPKAIKYMQLVFSMKDAISKRETREISAQFGVTVTQVLIFIPFHFQWLVKRKLP